MNVTKYFYIIFLSFSSSFILSSEIINTEDGRVIRLNDDGTYSILETETPKNQIEVTSHFFKKHIGKYEKYSIRFMPIFKNNYNKSIKAVKFDSTFLDPFGDKIYTLKEGKSEVSISPGKTSKTTLFYFWEDNQFINDQPYDKLLSSVTNSNGSIDTSIIAIVFEDGEVIKF